MRLSFSVSKSQRIEGTFEENLWIRVKENANKDRFRELLELRQEPDLFCSDPVEKNSKLTVFDFCREHDQKDIYEFLRGKLNPKSKAKVPAWSN